MWVWFALFLIVLVVVSAFDQRWYHVFRVAEGPSRDKLQGRDWYRLLRVMGYLPTWVLISALIALGPWAGRANREWGLEKEHASERRATMRRAVPDMPWRAMAWLPALSAGLSGAAAEILKLVIGRQRPGPSDGEYVFRPFLSGFVNGSNLGMPSSHAAVAFGGAFMLARLFPGLWAVAIALAVGCGVTRMWMGAHYATDVFVAGGLGYAIAWVLSPGAGVGGIGRKADA